MKQFQKIIRQHSRNYPLMQPQDVAKLLYQNEFGPGHFVEDSAVSLKRLQEEYRISQTNTSPFPIENIGNGFVRYAVFQLKADELEVLNRIFATTANRKTGDRKSYEQKLKQVLSDFDAYGFSFTKQQYIRFIEEQKRKDYLVVSHSEQYRRNYQPAYRVIDEKYVPFIPMLVRLESKWKQVKNKRFIVGIDGNSAAGKTTLSQCLLKLYPCEVIHMDDFFLPQDLRTEERLKEPGGNVHYERFAEEVKQGIQNEKEFSYRIFSCHKMDYAGIRKISASDMLVIEGAYSMRPEFMELYDYKIFMRIKEEMQLQRIRERNGAELCEIFKNKWIPMENRYFQAFEVEKNCDYVIEEGGNLG